MGIWSPFYSNGGTKRFVVIHTTEGINEANNLGYYFQRDSVQLSSHYGVDADKAVQYVDENKASWTAGPSANSVGIHIEMCATVGLTREQWLSSSDQVARIPGGNLMTVRRPYGLLKRTAELTREICQRRGFELVKLAPGEVSGGRKGICGHGDCSAVWPRETNHTDPGSSFPWDVFISLVNIEEGEDFLVALPQWQQERIYDRILRMSMGKAGENYDGEQFVYEQGRLNEVLARLDGLTAAVSALSTNKDLTVDEVTTIINEAIKQNIQITGNVEITGK